MYNSIEKNARLNSTYVILVVLSTIVVAIGLLKDNVAVVIGAMVIAPLLGPNIALALAAALGDTVLMWQSLKTSLVGMVLALGLSFLIGALWPLNVHSRELLGAPRWGWTRSLWPWLPEPPRCCPYPLDCPACWWG